MLSDSVLKLSPVLLAVFFSILYLILTVAAPPKLFFSRHARMHRLCGLLYLVCLSLGLLDQFVPFLHYLLWDVCLGVLGTVLALTAAWDFQHHRKIKNVASGALDEDATVTYDEMIEHSFYQALNLVQALFLRGVQTTQVLSPTWRSLAGIAWVGFVTSPWMLRHLFPVNSFSANYTKHYKPVTSFLYRLKKWQYVFYKHVLLHGLNISIAMFPSQRLLSNPIVESREWRLYWLGLNTAYTMEFFMQTLVKKKFLKQDSMIRLQHLLMTATSIAVLPVTVQNISPAIAVVSLVLNFLNRKHDMVNTMAICVACFGLQQISLKKRFSLEL